MKTGRVRTKEQPTKKKATTAAPPASPPASSRPPSSRPAQGKAAKIPLGVWIVGGLFIILVCVFGILTAFGGKRAEAWVESTRASGEWTTTVTVFGPQVTTEERWQSDCTATANAVVRTGTCVMKDTTAYQDTVVDEYDEYAYSIYYEEIYDQVYQAQGTEFVPAQLQGDAWWEDNLHYTLQEELDRDSCDYTTYTVWVDDPENTTQEMEVYLSECEVWDHVTVTERVYEQQSWCQCDVTTLVEMGQQSERGTGSNVTWPNPIAPARGRTEQAFKGQVTFLGGDYTYTTTTEDLTRYQDYLTGQYYIGLKDGKPVAVSKNPPQK
jgi:hypothetical protein